MSITSNALSRLADALNGPQQGIGERMTRSFFEVWEGGPADSDPLLAMLRGATTTEQAAKQLREFIQALLVGD